MRFSVLPSDFRDATGDQSWQSRTFRHICEWGSLSAAMIAMGLSIWAIPASCSAGNTPATAAPTLQSSDGTAADTSKAADTNKAADIAKVDAYLAGPMLQLADQLSRSNRPEAAEICRNWVPVRRPDAFTAYFSSASAKGPAGIENEPAISAAFAKARQETALRALRGAIRSAENGHGALALELLWRAVREDPNNQAVRKLLGLPAGNTTRSITRPGRAAPNILGWPQRSFLVGQSQHYRVYSTASKRETLELAEDLERYFEVWSQLFFQQWTTEQAICERIKAEQSIRLPAVVCEVVLFGERAAYTRTLGAENPASSQSTGYYSPEHKLTLLFAGPDADVETRYHEMTHQLLQEAVPQVVESPGLESGFWIVEGIASYMESIQFGESYATVGGWHSPRLQYSRARILPTRQVETLETILPLGRDQFQQREDLAAIYSTSAAYVHMLSEDQRSRELMFRYLKAIYMGRDGESLLQQLFVERSSDAAMVDYLSLSSWKGQSLPNPLAPLKVLCLNRTQLDAQQLASLASQAELEWLDLGLLPITSVMVNQLVGNQTGLRRLNLEATQIDDSIAAWLAQQRQLEELDLSFTPISDDTVSSLRSLGKLETVWLTGTKIGSQALPILKSLRTLRNLDVQRTGIIDNEIDGLRQSMPATKINPLILQ